MFNTIGIRTFVTTGLALFSLGTVNPAQAYPTKCAVQPQSSTLTCADCHTDYPTTPPSPQTYNGSCAASPAGGTMGGTTGGGTMGGTTGGGTMGGTTGGGTMGGTTGGGTMGGTTGSTTGGTMGGTTGSTRGSYGGRSGTYSHRHSHRFGSHRSGGDDDAGGMDD